MLQDLVNEWSTSQDIKKFTLQMCTLLSLSSEYVPVIFFPFPIIRETG